MVDISSKAKLEAWLEDQPQEVSVAIAARTAWRVLPLLQISQANKTANTSLMPVLRAGASALVAATHPTSPEGRKVAAEYDVADSSDAAFAVLSAASTALDFTDIASAEAASDVNAANSIVEAESIGIDAIKKGIIEITASSASASKTYINVYISVYASLRASGAYDAATEVVRFHAGRIAALDIDFWDANALANGRLTVPQLLIQPLWPKDIPDFTQKAWVDFAKVLNKSRAGFSVWAEWYDAVLKGGPRPHDAAFARAIDDLDLWNGSPTVVNARLKALVDEEKAKWREAGGQPLAEQLTDLPPPPPQVGGTHVGLNQQGQLDYTVVGEDGNNRRLIDELLPIVRALADDALEAVPDNAYKALSGRIDQYRQELALDPAEIRWSRAYLFGIRLEQGLIAARRDIDREGIPSLDDDAQEKVSSLLLAHHTLIGATQDGAALRQLTFDQQATANEQRSFAEAAQTIAEDFAANPDVVAPVLALDLKLEAEMAADPAASEKVAAANRGLVQNAVTGLVVTGTMGVVAAGSAATFGAAGLVGAVGVNFLLLEGLKKSQRFGELTSNLGKTADGILNTTTEFVHRKLMMRDMVVRLQSPLREIAQITRWTWIESYVDFAVSLKKSDLNGDDEKSNSTQ